MKAIIKTSIIALLLVATTLISCRKSTDEPNGNYMRLNGIWQSELEGSSTLYIISNGLDFNTYYYTYPYPVPENEQEAGWFSLDLDKGTITFKNAATEKTETFPYKLSNNDNTLTMGNIVYKKTVD